MAGSGVDKCRQLFRLILMSVGVTLSPYPENVGDVAIGELIGEVLLNLGNVCICLSISIDR